MRIHAVKACDLSVEQLQAWSEIQDCDATLASPFFRPEFTTLAASVWDRVLVGVIEEQGIPVGFFPFERHFMGISQPIAPMVSDCQGAIVRHGVNWNAQQLLEGCGISSMKFNHLIASQSAWGIGHTRLGRSLTIDLSDGYEAYVKNREEAGSVLKRLERQYRQFEREAGPIRIDLDVRDGAALEWVIREKPRQCVDKGYTDILSVPSIRRFMERIHATHTTNFSGMLSVVYAGGEIAAAHMGMRSQSLWHYWFPVYDEKFSKYSPGLLLLVRMAQAANGLGIRHIDLGKGESVYKNRLSNSGYDLTEARFAQNDFRSVAAIALGKLRDSARRSAWSGPLKRLYRWLLYR